MLCIGLNEAVQVIALCGRLLGEPGDGRANIASKGIREMRNQLVPDTVAKKGAVVVGSVLTERPFLLGGLLKDFAAPDA